MSYVLFFTEQLPLTHPLTHGHQSVCYVPVAAMQGEFLLKIVRRDCIQLTVTQLTVQYTHKLSNDIRVMTVNK